MEIRAGHATRMTSQFAMLAYPSKVLLSMSTATGKTLVKRILTISKLKKHVSLSGSETGTCDHFDRHIQVLPTPSGTVSAASRPFPCSNTQILGNSGCQPSLVIVDFFSHSLRRLRTSWLEFGCRHRPRLHRILTHF